MLCGVIQILKSVSCDMLEFKLVVTVRVCQFVNVDQFV